MNTEGSDQQDVERYESGQIAEKPDPSDEQKADAEKTHEAYLDDRPTTVLPGSDHTVTGTAVNDWLDDEGKPKFGEAGGGEGEGHRTLGKTDDRQNVADEDSQR